MPVRTSRDERAALVTGATSGLGRATALAFARRGVRVLVAGRNEERGREVVEEIRGFGSDAVFLAADLAREDSAARLVEATAERFGRLDYAFNSAAEVGDAAPLADCDERQFDRIVRTNLKSVWLCMKHQIRQMLAQSPPGGAIVNASSVNALGGVPGSSLYAMSKAGVVALTKSAALEYAGSGIRVNALVAGAFRTPMLESVMDRLAGGDPDLRSGIEEKYSETVPMGRIGSAEEAAEAVVWLCSDAASYVTGHSMIVDGGLTSPYR